MVRVIGEKGFGSIFDFEDPNVRALMEKLDISDADAHGYADAVTSLHVYAVK